MAVMNMFIITSLYAFFVLNVIGLIVSTKFIINEIRSTDRKLSEFMKIYLGDTNNAFNHREKEMDELFFIRKELDILFLKEFPGGDKL